MRKFWLSLLGVLLALVLLELILRWIGFGQIAIYYPSDKYEYALEPNQDLRRFGNEYFINEVGMRSAPLGTGEWRILKFGDSVLNGGAYTDQSDLASELLHAELKSIRPDVRVLQVSAGSWGPDNAFAWMMENGDFDAKMIVLVFSSHDWQDQMRFTKVVGVLNFYPDQQPALAITDACHWAWSRYFQDIDWQALDATSTRVDYDDHDLGWDQFIAYCADKNISLLIYHHADASEYADGSWNQDGLALEQFLDSMAVPAISGLETKLTPEDYFDDIHLTASGQRKLADRLKPYLIQKIEASE